MGTVRHPKESRFGFFDDALGHPNWEGKKILDFGGNHGNFLRGSPIDPKQYTCLDVEKAAIEEGQADFPEAQWIHWDMYNPVYNPNGDRYLNLPMELGTYDYIFAFSVFTHIPNNTTRSLVHNLYFHLAHDDGKMLISFLEPSDLKKFLDKRKRDGWKFNYIEKLKWISKNFSVLHDDVVINQDQNDQNDRKSYTVFRSPESMMGTLSDGRGRIPLEYVSKDDIKFDGVKQSAIIVNHP